MVVYSSLVPLLSSTKSDKAGEGLGSILTAMILNIRHSTQTHPTTSTWNAMNMCMLVNRGSGATQSIISTTFTALILIFKTLNGRGCIIQGYILP